MVLNYEVVLNLVHARIFNETCIDRALLISRNSLNNGESWVVKQQMFSILLYWLLLKLLLPF